jgi:hypothetical protein
MGSLATGLRLGLVLPVLILARPPEGAAQAPPTTFPRVEVWAAAGAATWSTEGRIPSDYSPQTALFVGDTRATQTLTLDPSTGRTFEGGINVFPWRNAGLQAFVAYGSADVEGANGPYDVRLSYISRPPPSYDPIPVTFTRSFAWPDTLGRIEQWTFGGGLVARTRPGPVGASIAAGLAVHRITGTAEELGFTVFHLGGHSTMFYDDFRLRVALGPTTMAGAYVGGAVDVEVTPHVALVAGLRACFGTEYDVTVATEAIAAREGGFEPPALADIDARLGPPLAQISPAGFRAFAGIKIR